MFAINVRARAWSIYQSMCVFVLVAIGNMFFRLESMHQVFDAVRNGIYIGNIVDLFDGAFLQKMVYVFGIDLKNFNVLVISLMIMAGVSRAQNKNTQVPVRTQIAHSHLLVRCFVLFSLLFIILVYGKYGPNYNAQSFIYMQF